MLLSQRKANNMSVLTGLDVLLQNETELRQLRDRKIGILAHAASINRNAEHIFFLLKAKGLNIIRVFAPEHGLWAAAQDMEGVDHGYDPIIGQEVYSLYGHSLETLAPESGALADLDTLIIDLQDVGARYYTFIYSAWILTQCCLRARKTVYILDRPNPIGGEVLEGNVVHEGFHSFVSYMPLPTRHAMTIAELIYLWSDEYLNDEERQGLHLIRMEGWKRSMMFDETGLPWVMPSPNMPTLETAIVYPGQCLLEGTLLSEGRGTTRPFEIFGAPWIKTGPTLEALRAFELPGVVFRPLRFKPTFQKQAHQLCNGFQLHVTDRNTFESVATTVCILSVLIALHPDDFAWRTEKYEFIEDIPAIDLLFGDNSIRTQLESHRNPIKIIEAMSAERESFMPRRAAHLLY